MYENRADNLRKKQRLNKISTLIFTAKDKRNQLEIIVEATYGLNPY